MAEERKEPVFLLPARLTRIPRIPHAEPDTAFPFDKVSVWRFRGTIDNYPNLLASVRPSEHAYAGQAQWYEDVNLTWFKSVWLDGHKIPSTDRLPRDADPTL